ncbi:uncharacterized protein [Chiloscyllium punctatum]|uniref:uncharacterized protein isoform X4 n=1 Tax=Chiloscyllium punctatum TaxID=137246 RepID=UPI003B63DB5F
MRWMDVLENIPDVKRSSGALDRGSLTEKYQPVFRPLTKYSSSTAHQQIFNICNIYVYIRDCREFSWKQKRGKIDLLNKL